MWFRLSNILLSVIYTWCICDIDYFFTEFNIHSALIPWVWFRPSKILLSVIYTRCILDIDHDIYCIFTECYIHSALIPWVWFRLSKILLSLIYTRCIRDIDHDIDCFYTMLKHGIPHIFTSTQWCYLEWTLALHYVYSCTSLQIIARFETYTIDSTGEIKKKGWFRNV